MWAAKMECQQTLKTRVWQTPKMRVPRDFGSLANSQACPKSHESLESPTKVLGVLEYTKLLGGSLKSLARTQHEYLEFWEYSLTRVLKSYYEIWVVAQND